MECFASSELYFHSKEKMIPFGILNLEDDQLYIFYGNSYKTSDFIYDAIEQWWEIGCDNCSGAGKLLIVTPLISLSIDTKANF